MTRTRNVARGKRICPQVRRHNLETSSYVPVAGEKQRQKEGVRPCPNRCLARLRPRPFRLPAQSDTPPSILHKSYAFLHGCCTGVSRRCKRILHAKMFDNLKVRNTQIRNTNSFAVMLSRDPNYTSKHNSNNGDRGRWTSPANVF